VEDAVAQEEAVVAVGIEASASLRVARESSVGVQAAAPAAPGPAAATATAEEVVVAVGGAMKRPAMFASTRGLARYAWKRTGS
jgi:hypothetical protein